MTFSDKIKEISETVQTLGKAMFCWSGHRPVEGEPPPEEPLVKINYVFLHIAIPLGGGRVVARKVAGTRVLLGSNWKLVFSTNLLRAKDRITGTRRVVLPKDMRVTEEACPAGQSKEVREGYRPYELSPERISDSGMVETMLEMVRAQAPVMTDRVVFPRAYLGAYAKDDYIPKNDGRLMELLKASPDYSDMGGVGDNFDKCFHHCFDKGPEDRYMVDYCLVNGKGIPFLDMASVHKAYTLQGHPLDLDLEEEVYALDVESSITKILEREKRQHEFRRDECPSGSPEVRPA